MGAKSLTMKSACIIALFTEFIGAAVTLGSEVANTIKGKILVVSDFGGQSETLMVRTVFFLIRTGIAFTASR